MPKQQRTLYNVIPKLLCLYKEINEVNILDAFFSDVISDLEYITVKHALEHARETNSSIIEIAGYQII